MPADEASLEALLHEWQELAAGDRKAILRRLPAARRLEFQRLIAASAPDQAVAHARRYRGYSAWLARLLADCEAGGVERGRLKPALLVALADAHELASGSAAAQPAPASAQELARALLQRVRDVL